ncbi:HlyD family secretion protein [uncultured Marinobacter sp.]|uniref:HlyD family secretion protein n=1 Tax=uncultured Marinobacter sp. TaxID=187379 RepID=UPI0030DA1DA5
MSSEQTKVSSAKPTGSTPRRLARLLLVAVLLLGCVWWFASWFYYRQIHVIEDNASITTNLVTVSSRLPGLIQEFVVTEGDQLDEGSLIARLYSAPDELELDKRQSRVARMQAQVAFEEQQIALSVSQLEGGVQVSEGELATDLAALRVAETDLEDAERTWKRSQRLFESGTLPGQERDRDYFAYQSALARVEQARQQVLVRRTALANARLGVATSQMTLPNPEMLRARLDVTLQDLEEARADLKQQRQYLDDMIIRSPRNGVVNRIFVEAGEYLSAGQPILMMHTADDLWVEAKIKETRIGELRAGQPVRVRVDAYPEEEFTGTVQVIGRAATSQFALLPNPNPSGNFTKITQRLPVRISLDDGPTELLGPGMMVTVVIDIRESAERD